MCIFFLIYFLRSLSRRCQTHHSRCLNMSFIHSVLCETFHQPQLLLLLVMLYNLTVVLKQELKKENAWSFTERRCHSILKYGKMSSLSNTFDLWKHVGICCSFKKLASKHGLTFLSSCKINVRHAKNKKLANISLKYKNN